MAAISQIIAHIVTADVEHASTGSWIYLGLGGREFSLDTHDVDFSRGADACFLLGEESNVKYSDYNDPRTPPLSTEDLAHSPVYLRVETAGDGPAWCLEWVSVTVNPDTSYRRRFIHPSLAGSAREHRIWLDTGYGKAVYLRPVDDAEPRH
ncbi:hypothetical protein CP967_32425 [Streptomyces nitrosporeus]|uniref:PLAT domain-containing protein n=1 Tax=Streptomyces nitrosporeus TaxID=28894 RepID=A0A5J6FJ85_9ACTN|nr:hypothetical protein [Streptomyces nitrosporeus]QEU76051.1 hypothetical protein CP967_32425 [Streptomyces nitrosporeus]GGZ07449.1 hypothetical protein GCM10010327_42350 [Streptomyces nitrosporeus]